MGNQQSINIGGFTVRIKRQIAEGGFAYVYLVEDDEGKKYALKRVIVPIDDRERNAAARNEHQMLRAIPAHPNIVHCVAHGVQDGDRERNYYTLMEYCHSSAWSLMVEATHSGQHLPERIVMRAFHDAAVAIHHLHTLDPPVAHRDLKVENLLVGDDGSFKLCDFGSCTTQRRSFESASTREITLAEEEISKNTTLAYRAPEQADLYRRQMVCEKVDTWALGVVLYKLVCGRTPFEDPAGNVEKMGILNNRVKWPDDFQYSFAIQDFVRFMMNPDPVTRPSAYEVLVWAQRAFQEGSLPNWPSTDVEGMSDGLRTESHNTALSGSSKEVAGAKLEAPLSHGFVNESFLSNLSWLSDVPPLPTTPGASVLSPQELDPLNSDPFFPSTVPQRSDVQQSANESWKSASSTQASVSPKLQRQPSLGAASALVQTAKQVQHLPLNLTMLPTNALPDWRISADVPFDDRLGL
jgi:AP2-associated kinase